MTTYGLDLLYRPDLPAVIARWHHDVSPAELRAGYEALLATADAAGCARWLLDLRRRDDLSDPGVNAWFSQTFIPGLRGRYATAVRLAFLVSPLRAQQPTTAEPSLVDSDCKISIFIDEAAAYSWLGER